MGVSQEHYAPETLPTQRDLSFDVAAELEVAGFSEPVEVGRGGFGVVYRCGQPALGRSVAVKVLTGELDEDNRERFLREERAMGALSGHPNIVEILEVDVTATGRPFIVMPYHGRGSLETAIRSNGPLPWPDAVRLGIKLAGAVETAHRAGILHRDVKPGNVLLTSYGEPQLTDFGVARVSGAFETSGHAIIGSPAFTAPEVLKGAPPSPTSDIYGLGATLFAALTGHAAFERRSGEKVVTQFLRITTEPIPDLRTIGIPEQVAAVVEASMSLEPADRPASAAEFGEQLREVELGAGMPVEDMALPDNVPTGTTVRPWSGPVTPGAISSGRDRMSIDTGPPTASTKYQPPTTNVATPMRPRLLDKLRAGAPRRLTVIHGPAGSGKTTLAAQWRLLLLEDNATVAWLRLDDDDNHVVWFLAHLIEAIERARPGISARVDPSSQTGDPAKYLLKVLIDDIVDCCDPTVVVLEDWHYARDEATRHALEFLLDNAAPNLLLVVTGQGRGGLPLGRTRLRDELVEIDPAELWLDVAETGEVLAACNELEVGDVVVSVVHAATEGWVAAVQLVGQSIAERRRRGNDDGANEAISSLATRRIDEYLGENLVADLDRRMLAFLMSISIAERVTGSLASVLAEVADGQAMLEEAEELDLFVRRVADDPEWFRMHPLFAGFLRRRMQRDHPGLFRVLHVHASEWFAQHRMVDRAVDHALAAADPNRLDAAPVVEPPDTLGRPPLAAVLGLLSRLPEGVLPRGKLMMAMARTNIALSQSDTVRSALDRLDRLLRR